MSVALARRSDVTDTDEQQQLPNAWSDLLHTVPALIDALPWESLVKISAVSKAHRQQVHDRVTSIALKNSGDILLVLNGQWPQLNTWRFTRYFNGTNVHISYTRNNFHMSSQPLSTGAVRKLCLGKLEHLQQLSLPACRLDVRSLAALNCGLWSGLKQLNLAKNHLDLSAMAELNAGPMRHLQYLDLSGNNMGVRALSEMAKGRWSDLRVLNWSGNAVSVSAVFKLSEKLASTELHLSNCFDVQRMQCTPKPYKIKLHNPWDWISCEQEVLWCQKRKRFFIYRRFSCFPAWSCCHAR